MIIKLYQVDAFTDQLFSGNPAAVCPLPAWLSDELMQKIAAENNLSETAFFVPHGDHYAIRWFTPVTEVALCGHATLAAAYVIFNVLDPAQQELSFQSKSGELIVTKKNNHIILDFPAVPTTSRKANALLSQILQGVTPVEIRKGTDYMVVLKDEAQVRQYTPDFSLIEKLNSRGLVITAPGTKADFVSRWFGPQVGVNEDPVTGSAHCMLAPYWSDQLNETLLYAEQLSARGGKMYCEIKGDRVLLIGEAVLYMAGEIQVPGK